MGEKSVKNWIWKGLGLHLGGVWGALGRLLGALGGFLGGFWAFKIEFFFSIGPRWAPRGNLERFLIDFGRLWGGFGEALGRDLGEFARIRLFWAGCGQILGMLGQNWSCWGRFYN